VPVDQVKQNTVDLTGEQARQISHVLRLHKGDQIVVLDNTGWEYEVQLVTLSTDLVTGKVLKKMPSSTEPNFKITLYQALLKSDKFEYALQKCTEIGVKTFVPISCERSVPTFISSNRFSRWKTIIREAAEQSRRSIIPELQSLITFEEACRLTVKPSVLFWEEERAAVLANFIKTPLFQGAREIGLFIGPEGGFTEAEADNAKRQGIKIATLGHRILRAETAGLVAVTIALYEKGELG